MSAGDRVCLTAKSDWVKRCRVYRTHWQCHRSRRENYYHTQVCSSTSTRVGAGISPAPPKASRRGAERGQRDTTRRMAKANGAGISALVIATVCLATVSAQSCGSACGYNGCQLGGTRCPCVLPSLAPCSAPLHVVLSAMSCRAFVERTPGRTVRSRRRPPVSTPPRPRSCC